MALVPCDDLSVNHHHHAQSSDGNHSSECIVESSTHEDFPPDIIKTKLLTLDRKMKNILDNEKLTADEKVRLYNDTLEDYLTFSNKYKENKESQSSASQFRSLQSDSEEKGEDNEFLRDTLRTTLPKTYQKAGDLIFDYLQNRTPPPWNSRGELIYDGKVVDGSHIIELIHDRVRTRRSAGKLIAGRKEFEQILKEINFPTNITHLSTKPQEKFTFFPPHIPSFQKEKPSPKRKRTSHSSPSRVLRWDSPPKQKSKD